MVNESKVNEQMLGIFLLIITIMLLVWAIKQLLNALYLQKHGILTNGVIHDIEKIRDSESGNYYYEAKIHFDTLAAERIDCQKYYHSSVPQLGQATPILYHPTQPQDYLIDDPNAEDALRQIKFGIGLAIFSVCLSVGLTFFTKEMQQLELWVNSLHW